VHGEVVHALGHRPGEAVDGRLLAERALEIGAESAAASRVPTRSRSASGPANAFWTVTCWSSAKPISSAIGSLAISSLDSSDSVKYRRSGIG